MRFLVVGSTAEATLACAALSNLPGAAEVWSYPIGNPQYAVISRGLPYLEQWSHFPRTSIGKVNLRDRWGKQLFSLSLKGFEVVSLSTPAQHPQEHPGQRIDPALELVRCYPSEQETICVFSDGSELAVKGVIFADGPLSLGRKLAAERAKPTKDPNSVACWSFTRQDLLDLSSWEFRTALGKSVEQLPITGGKVCIKLRFKTSVVPRQSVAELHTLFSEFGSDMEAILEGVQDENIARWIEHKSTPVFSPLPGAISLGSAALGSPILESFDWPLQLATKQIQRLTESLASESWNGKAWEPEFLAATKLLLSREEKMRSFLHYDNALLRPLRDAVLKLAPSALLERKVRQALGL